MHPNANSVFHRFATKAKFRHLSLLIHLHELGNMKRAAEAMNLSQPAISLAVSELEKLLGVQLFLRHARGVEPTPVATELLPVARRVMAALGDGAEIISNAVSESAGFVRIAATPAAESAMLHPVVRRFAQRFPKVHVEISEISAANPFEVLSDGACDILCLRKPEVTPETWQFEEVLSDALVVVCGAQNPLAKQGTATVEELRECHWILTRRGSVARNRFEDFAEEMQLPPENRCGIITHVPMLTQELLVKGKYLTLVPRSVAMPWITDGLAVELNTPATTKLLPLGFLWKSDDARRVTKMLASELRGLRER